ncbi:flagellar hook-basal body complex protein FliE [Paracoccaceae bacterium GXU_MW_L88]
MLQSVAASQIYNGARPAIQPDAAQPAGRGAIAQKAEDFVSILHEGETTAQAALTGEGDARSVVEALTRSELAVEAAVAIRDKVVEAYQEILRMPV